MNSVNYHCSDFEWLLTTIVLTTNDIIIYCFNALSYRFYTRSNTKTYDYRAESKVFDSCFGTSSETALHPWLMKLLVTALSAPGEASSPGASSFSNMPEYSR